MYIFLSQRIIFQFEIDLEILEKYLFSLFDYVFKLGIKIRVFLPNFYLLEIFQIFCHI